MADLPEGWTAHKAPTGHTYYYNKAQNKSTYKKPEINTNESNKSTNEEQAVAEHTHGIRRDVFEEEKDEDDAQEEDEDEVDDEEEEEEEDYPKRRKEIPNAVDWYLIETKFHRKFVYNPTLKLSLWKIPENVQRAIDQMEQDEIRETIALQSGKNTGAQNEGIEEMTEEDLLAQLEEAGVDDQQDGEEDEELGLEERIEHFLNLLNENEDLDAFGVWDTELLKIVNDPRYVLINTNRDRKRLFEEWAKQKMEAIIEAKKDQVTEDPKLGYIRLLKENAKKNQFWTEFKRKVHKEKAFDRYATERERERLFKDFAARLKLSKETRRDEAKEYLRRYIHNAGLQEDSTKIVSIEQLPPAVRTDIILGVVNEEEQRLILGEIATEN